MYACSKICHLFIIEIVHLSNSSFSPEARLGNVGYFLIVDIQ